MDKSEFLKEISKMDRDQIRKVIESNPYAKKKKICPVYFVKSHNKKKGEKKK